MITEDHTSLEIAKLLKEKGFDERTDYIYYYYEEDGDYCFEQLWRDEKFNPEKMISCPTHQMAMKWLREEYRMFVTIVFFAEKQGCGFSVEEMAKERFLGTSRNHTYKTYEEAAEAAIKYILENLI